MAKGRQGYEGQYRERVVRGLTREAGELGFGLKAREEAGDRLTRAQREMWREALKEAVSA